MRKLRHYSTELKAEAVKLVIEQGFSQPEVADRLGIPKGTIGNWIASAKNGTQSLPPGTPSIADLMVENRRLRKELSETKLEKEILKKAAAYFAKESFPGTRS